MQEEENLVEWKLVFKFFLCVLSILGLLYVSDLLEPVLWFMLVAIISAIH